MSNIHPNAAINGPILYVGLSLTDFKSTPSYATGTTGINRLQFNNKDPFHLGAQQLLKVGNVCYNAGKAGDTAANILTRWPTDAFNYPMPGTMVFCDGGNDVNLIQDLLATNGSTGIEDVLSAYASGTLSLFNQVRALGIQIIMEALPDNGNWSSLASFAKLSFNSLGARTYAQMHAYYRMARWHKEISRYLGLTFINHNVSLVYPARQLGQAASTVTGNGVTLTAVLSSPMPSDWATGDAVVNYTATLNFGALVPAIITVVNTTTFTYLGTGTVTAAVPGTFQRINVNNTLFTVPSVGVHYNQKAGVKLGYITQEALQGGSDWLAESEQDPENLVGAAQVNVTDDKVLNRGQMQGTSGTFSGTWNTTSGTPPTGWDVNLMNTSTGSSVAVLSVSFPPSDPGRSFFNYCDFTVTAGSADAHIEIRSQHLFPSDWAASTAQALGTWRMPTNHTLGIAAVCIANTSDTKTGTVEPTWSSTPGILIVDGNMTWEMRRIWKFDGITKYRIGADYRFISQSASGALLSRCLLLADDPNSYYIGDGEDVDANGSGANSTTPPPLYTPGEHVHFCSPDAILRTSGSTSQSVALRLWVSANQTIRGQLGRASWYRTGYGIPDTSGNILGAI